MSDGSATLITDPVQRQAFVEKAEQYGPVFTQIAVGDDVLKSVAAALPGFKEDDGSPRILFSHPDALPPEPLVTAPREARKQVRYETGAAKTDLAVWMNTGVPVEPTEVRSFADGSFSSSEAVAILTRDRAFEYDAPFQGTDVGLINIGSGRRRGLQPTVVVLGVGSNDLALAMLLSRLAGNAIWLPLDPSDATWQPAISAALLVLASRARQRDQKGLLVTSTTLDEPTCIAQFAGLSLPSPSITATYVDPLAVPVMGRFGLRLFDVWDERFSVPIRRAFDGSVEMVTTFPLLAPVDLPAGLQGWIVQAIWTEDLVHAHRALGATDLFAADQNIYETFVRPSDLGIAFESGRFDWVPAGGSKFAQLAQPKLRWPGLHRTVQRAASAAGHFVETSYAGTLSEIAVGLWRGRDELAKDLRGVGRRLLNTFVATGGPPGPLDKGPGYDSTNTRVWVNKRCLVPFGALGQAAAPDLDESGVRAWLDGHITRGSIRAGLALICKACRWADFYRMDELGTRFDCKRCGSTNMLTQGRWKQPPGEPTWYYDLHAPVTNFLEQHGDVPILAVDQYSRGLRVFGSAFELEFYESSTKKAQMEIDFTLMTEHGLVVGEAKSNDNLDGKNEDQRVKDAAKLLRAAAILDAQEVCFASSVTWSASALSAIEKAVALSPRRVVVSSLQELASDNPPARVILHNPEGR